MAQHRLDSVVNKTQTRHELYALFQKSLNKKGDSNNSHFLKDSFVTAKESNERVGLYY